jgi:hypothetical protein
MSDQSHDLYIKQFEDVCCELEAIEGKICEAGGANPVVHGLRLLHGAYLDFAAALYSWISMPVFCAEFVRAKEELDEALITMVLAESRLGCFDEGTFVQRQGRFEAAERRWLCAINLGRTHRSECPTCLAAHSRQLIVGSTPRYQTSLFLSCPRPR